MSSTISTDEDEHDLTRDEVMESLAEIDDDIVRVSRAYGHVTAGLIVLAQILNPESMDEFLAHVSDTARDLNRITEEVAQ